MDNENSREGGQESPKELPSKPERKPRYLICPQCSASFTRADHLKRHINTHKGSKQYQCRCGKYFSRSDVLGRHLRRCNVTQNDPGLFLNRRKNQSRSKTACDQCAKLKLKCDSSSPCQNCQSHNISCLYTRQGYFDPYRDFQTGNTGSSQQDASTKRVEKASESEVSEPSPTTRLSPPAEERNAVDSGSPTNPSALDLDGLFDIGDCFNMPPWEQTDPQSEDADLDASPIDSSQMLQFRLEDVWRSIDPVPNLPQLSFSLSQIDPVEAKCRDIQELLKEMLPAASERRNIDKYVTRDMLVTCSKLYGDNLQHNVPILHMPTFNLTETSTILACAIMLLGACYSDGLMPMSLINSFAMRSMAWIRKQRDEMEVKSPPMSTIQASILITLLLINSRDEAAFQFATSCFPHNLSMAEEAGLFDPAEPSSDDCMAGDQFDWYAWIDRETRRRVACQVFCHDMASCVFMRRSPALLPLACDVVLPCYECCWEASTADECWQQLQVLPDQVSIAEAMRRFQSPVALSPSFPVLESSAWGMFVLILAIHCLLFQALQNIPDSSLDSSQPTDPGDQLANSILSALRDGFGRNVASLADRTVSGRGSATIRNINKVLTLWLDNWNSRLYRDVFHENRAFSADPVKFWHLAKLYIVLHYCRRDIFSDEGIALAKPGSGGNKTKMRTQAKILGWLLLFSKQESQYGTSEGSHLTDIMRPLIAA